MATIQNVVLSLKRDKDRNLVNVKVTGKISFTKLEQCIMKTCKDSPLFKLKCKLFGDDAWLTGADDDLYTFPNVKVYSDGSPAPVENFEFETVVGGSLLDEDFGKDEIYAKVKLYNLLAGTVAAKNSNVVTGWF